VRGVASIDDWVVCGGGLGAIGSSGMAIRVEEVSAGERPSSDPRAIAIVVEVLRMCQCISHHLPSLCYCLLRTVATSTRTYSFTDLLRSTKPTIVLA
jgi:hypothetical protein